MSSACLARYGLAALAVTFGATGLQDAVANGDTRTISMHHVHTGEDITITYKKDGRFDAEALKKLNWFLRDWRRNEPTKMDPYLIDIVWEVWREVGAKEPISIIGGYRAPATNKMLRKRSKGVARHSQHTLGHAMDFYIPGASLEEMRHAGLRLQRGGVGYYPSSGSPFVHLDTGSVRHWPRMTHDQLARVFPNGRTVHVPSDGKPLPGYELALAEVQKRGSTPSETSLAAARDAGIATGDTPRRSLLASLFGGGKDADEDEATASVTPAAKRANTVAAIDIKPEPARKEIARIEPARIETARTETAPVPLPMQRPAMPVQTAALVPQATISASTSVPATASAIVAARGGWDDAGALRQIGDPAPFKTASLSAEPQVTSYAAIAYAAPSKVAPAKTSGLRFTRRANAGEINFEAPKESREPATSVVATPQPRFDDIWLRAVMLAPDLSYYLSATLIGASDPKELRTLMRKPSAALAMSFSEDPMDGMASDHFSGEAVVFLETVSFLTRTAALR